MLTREQFEDRVRHWNGNAMLSNEGMVALLAHDAEQRERIAHLITDRDRWIKEYEELQEKASAQLIEGEPGHESCVGCGRPAAPNDGREACPLAERLATFGRRVIEEYDFASDIDGGWIQDTLVELDLVHHPDGPIETCASCAEFSAEECWHPRECSCHAPGKEGKGKP